MSLKAKLISTISAFVLILTIVIVAVWAASTANVTLGGTVNFQATNVYAKVTGTVTGMDSNPTLPTLIFSEGEDASEEPEIEQWNNLDLVFKTSGTPIEIEVTVENLSDERSLGVSIQNQIASIENIDISITSGGEASTSATLSPSTGSGTSTVTFLVTVSLQNPNVSVTDALYDILIKLTDGSQLKQINVHSNLEGANISGSGLYAIGDTITLTAMQNESGSAMPLGFARDSSYENFIYKFNMNAILGGKGTYSFVLTEDSPTDYYCFYFDMGTGAQYEDLDTSSPTYGFGLMYSGEFAMIAYYSDSATPRENVTHFDLPNTTTIDGKEYRIIMCLGAEHHTLQHIYPNLQSISIPENFQFIVGYNMFYGLSSLTQVTVSENNNSFSDMGKNVVYDKLSKAVVAACSTSEIPEETIKIEAYAFSGTSITSFSVPDNITEIWEGTFYGCRNLTSITIPEGVTSIGEQAFSDCSSLTSITIPEGVTSIGSSAFSGCSSLTSITIPEGVTSIGSSAFSGCSSLTSITIPEGVISIGDNAFYGCSSLTSITIPEGVTSIGDRAFHYCSGLTSITIPESVTSIGSYAFQSCSSLTSITIPEGVTSIGSSAFEGCSKLTSITIPEGVTSIGDNAFYGCSSLTSITIPEGVTSIGQNAFYSCSSLTSITLPSTLTSIGSYAFSYCSNLAEITINGNISTLDSYAFPDCSNLTKLTLGSNVTSLPSNLFTSINLTNLTEIVVEAGSTLNVALPDYGTWEKDGATVTSFTGAGTYTRTDI